MLQIQKQFLRQKYQLVENIRNNLLFMKTYQTVMKIRDRDIHTNKLYWFTLSQSYIQSSVKPLSISLCNQSQITTTHTTKR